jgi:hypothetical protein
MIHIDFSITVFFQHQSVDVLIFLWKIPVVFLLSETGSSSLRTLRLGGEKSGFSAIVAAATDPFVAARHSPQFHHGLDDAGFRLQP